MADEINMVVLSTVIVGREIDGKQVRVTPEIGKAFPFTAEEIENIKEANPSAIREPVNEAVSEGTVLKPTTDADVAAAKQADADAAKQADADAAKAGGKKTTAKADDDL